MKLRLDKLFVWIKHHYIWSGTIALIIIVAIFNIFFQNSDDGEEIIVLEPQEFFRTVEVAGKVTPSNDVELGFETIGRIAVVYKKEGDRVYQGETLVSLSSEDASADVLKAKADFGAEVARFNELTNGENIEKKLFDAIYDAYTRSDDAVRNSVDQVYNEDDEIVFAFDDHDLRIELNKSRGTIERLLVEWKKSLDNINAQSFSQSDTALAINNLNDIKDFLDRVALAVNNFEIGSSSYTQTEIDTFKTNISSARLGVNTAITNLITAKENLRDIDSEIPYQEAKVKAAEATVRSYQSELSKRVITAPFSGIVTKQDAEVGQIVSVNTVVMRLISDSNFTIETFVPEINIKEVAVGNIAKVTLDAYGEEEIFEAKVISVDPGETIRDGVSTYKVIFEFINNGDRLKSGMTANVVITTETKPDALLIPKEAIIKKNGFSYVYVMVGKEKVEKQITIGATASNGYVEVITGLSAGEIVVKNAQ